jgi:hypothetical protein
MRGFATKLDWNRYGKRIIYIDRQIKEPRIEEILNPRRINNRIRPLFQIERMGEWNNNGEINYYADPVKLKLDPNLFY